MQIILLDKVANLGNLGDVVKVKGRLRPQLPDSQPHGASRHRGGDQGVRGALAPSSRRPPPKSWLPRRRWPTR